MDDLLQLSAYAASRFYEDDRSDQGPIAGKYALCALRIIAESPKEDLPNDFLG